MKIKEAAKQSGLTVRAIRLYQDAELIHPETYLHNGRKYTEYSAADVERLKIIAQLRGAMFSISQIKTISDSPERTEEVFESYRTELNAEFGRLKELVSRVNDIDASRIDGVGDLSKALGGVEGVGLPGEDRNYRPQICKLDDGIGEKERMEAYAAWQKKQELRDRFAFLTDWSYRISDRMLRRVVTAVILTAVGIPLLLLLWYNIALLCARPVTIEAEGWEISLTDPGYAKPASIRVDGKLYRGVLTKPPYFLGDIEIEGYAQCHIFYGNFFDTTEVRIPIDRIPPNNMLSKNSDVWIIYRTTSGETHDAVGIVFDEDYETVAANTIDEDGAEYYIVCPAASPEEARSRVKDIYASHGWSAD